MDTEGDSLLYTAQEIAQGIIIQPKNEEGTTNLEDNSDQSFDYDLESTFDDEEDSDKDEEDENIMWFAKRLSQECLYSDLVGKDSCISFDSI